MEEERFIIDSNAEHCMSYWRCPECNYSMDPFLSIESEDSLFNHICGIDHPFFVVECPDCFHRWKFHYSEGLIKRFFKSVENGTNLHFK